MKCIHCGNDDKTLLTPGKRLSATIMELFCEVCSRITHIEVKEIK